MECKQQKFKPHMFKQNIFLIFQKFNKKKKRFQNIREVEKGTQVFFGEVLFSRKLETGSCERGKLHIYFFSHMSA